MSEKLYMQIAYIMLLTSVCMHLPLLSLKDYKHISVL